MEAGNGTIVVTGASGFVAGHLIERLASAGTVIGWSRSAPTGAIARLARWKAIDLLDRDRVRAAIREARPTAIYHCAGATHAGQSWSDPAGALASNVLATHYLLDALRRAEVTCRVLVTGSAAIYAASSEPISESSPLAPDSPYATSKLAQEMLGRRSVTEDGMAVIVTRPFNHTGPRQTPDFVAPAIARQIALVERGGVDPVLRVGNLHPRRDLTDVRDVVRAYVALMRSGVPGEVYNVASGVAHSIEAIVEGLVARARVPVRIDIDPARLRPVDNPVLVGDASKLRAATGWQPRIPFDRMLDDLLAYWRVTA